MMQSNDSVSKNIQNQIANAQKQLQELSANKEMSIEEKMKKRQEIQQQITDLNNQLRQHQIEQRKEQQAKKSSMDDMLGGKRKVSSKAGSQSNGLSQASMKAMLSADSAIAQSKVQGSVATKMDGRAGVLEAEIKLDIARGGDVTKKKEELAEVQQKAIVAEAAQLDTLTDANKELEEAAKADQQVEKTDDKDSVSNVYSNLGTNLGLRGFDLKKKRIFMEYYEKYSTTDIISSDEYPMITKANFNSPGFWEVIGQCNPFEQLRNYIQERHLRIRDRRYVWEMQNKKELAELESKQLSNDLLKLDITQKMISQLREIGLSDIEIRHIVQKSYSNLIAFTTKLQ